MTKETKITPNKPPKMKNKKCCPICGKDEFIKDNGSILECTKCLTGFKYQK